MDVQVPVRRTRKPKPGVARSKVEATQQEATMSKYLVAGSAMALLIALAMPVPAAAAKQSPSPSAASGALPAYTADVATEELSAHRRRYRHTHRYYSYRRYYGYPYYAYAPGPYYYGPRYYYRYRPAPFPFFPFGPW